jgi:predicted porin
MQRLGVVATMIVALASAVYSTGAWADDTMATKAAPQAQSSQGACTNIWDFFSTSCPLSWYGITVYGTIDAGVTWLSHGAPLSDKSTFGQLYLISKQSNRPRFDVAPNGLSQSVIGIKGNEELAKGWSFIFDLEAGFDPYSLRLADGPRSVAGASGVPLTEQDSQGDSNRAGQFYNQEGYFGISSPTYGTLTVFRQNTLTLDGVNAYDPMGGSYAFSPIGFSGTTCGIGDTELCRLTTALKYRVTVGQFRAAALWQFGGYTQNNPTNGAYQAEMGVDVPRLAGGTLSLDAIGSYAKDAVSLALSGNTLPAVLPQVFTATISDQSSVMLLGKYAHGPLSLYAGYEWIEFAPPSDPQNFFTDISGNFLCAGCADFNNTNINNTAFNLQDKILQIFWTGAKYTVITDVDVIGAYYHYYQPQFGAPTNCGPTIAIASGCAGTLDALSFAVDWQFAKKFDAYAGIMYSQVHGGLASGYLNRNNVDPTVGLRFRF